MTSRGYIFTACTIAMVLYWTTGLFADGMVPIAMIAAFLLMDAAGRFRQEMADADIGVDKEDELDELTDRQKEFRRLLKEGKENQQLEQAPGEDDEAVSLADFTATIKMINQDGVRSVITIEPDGEIRIHGHPEPEVIQAISQLKSTVKQHGAMAVAEELGRQIDEINRSNN